ncbi:MAG: capsular biosynthesis protein [Lachnospiraceae bacterium]|nr:capsular biosynthesis protein [Lachnospiraceae bacterium]
MLGITDIHCHILPGVDDGPDHLEESLAMLRMEYEQGVRRIILTPHYRRGYFETTREVVKEKYREVEAQVRASGMELELYLGCELHRLNGMADMLKQEKAFCMAATSYVLVEFSGHDTPDAIRHHITELLIHGYRPIIAHAERYPALRDLKQIRFLADSGACIQVNAGSILGTEGWGNRQFCRRLLKEHLVDLIGSDAHGIRRRPPSLGMCADWLVRKFGEDTARKLLIENPQKIITNEYV